MGHNPRTPRRDPKEPTALSGTTIDDAMSRAVAMRRRNLGNAADVHGIALDADEAVELTMKFRLRSPGYRAEHWRQQPDPWWWIGWVRVGDDVVRRVWGVWLNVDDDRIWLRWERRGGRSSADDPYR